MEDIDFYKFKCDFYYLHYDISDKLHGTIYKHYYIDDKIEYNYGINDTEIKELNDKVIKTKIITEINKLNKNLKLSNNIRKKDKYNYLNMYDFNSSDFENYYKKLSLSNLANLIDIEIDADIINIGILFTFMKTDNFNIDNIILNNSPNNTSFKDYCKSFIRTSRTPSNIFKVKTEQKTINLQTIKYYETEKPNNLNPVIIEYDYEKKRLFIVDGNHRVAFHILNKHEYIPVIIIFKYLDIGIYE